MIALVLSIALGFLADGNSDPLAPGAQLTFRGKVSQARPEQPAAGESLKTFDLTLLVSESDDSGTRAFWLVDERGHGAWPWLDRFGQLALDARYRPVGAEGPALLYDYGTGKHPVVLLDPFFEADTMQMLAVGTKWQQEGWDYEIEGSKELADRPTWKIVGQNAMGVRRTLWLDKQVPLLVAYNERVFMDKGSEYNLEVQLVGNEQLDADGLHKAREGYAALLALRTKLKHPLRSQQDELPEAQRAVAAAELSKLATTITAGPLAGLVRAARGEQDQEQNRADALAKLTSKHVGQSVVKFSLPSLAGEEPVEVDPQGHVTILHFWDYRDDPLKEPYGQVGYLEFLHNRRKAEGVQVFGVAVDGRLRTDATRRAAVSSVRKLKNFMNLTYPILLDDGTLLKQFDDPRLVGGALPLFVVIGPDGKVVDYHSGFYPVDRQDGLKALDSLVGDLVKEP